MIRFLHRDSHMAHGRRPAAARSASAPSWNARARTGGASCGSPPGSRAATTWLGPAEPAAQALPADDCNARPSRARPRASSARTREEEVCDVGEPRALRRRTTASGTPRAARARILAQLPRRPDGRGIRSPARTNAAAKPTIPATSSVPPAARALARAGDGGLERRALAQTRARRRPWAHLACAGEVESDRRRDAARRSGSQPAAWTASVWNGMAARVRRPPLPHRLDRAELVVGRT